MKKVLFSILLLCSISILSANCLQGNCTEGEGKFQFSDGSTYYGGFKKSKLDGYGAMHYSNGNIYKGQWKNDVREGKGELLFANGDHYIGHFLANKFWGKGIFKYSDGDRYEGEWKNHLAHGKGIYYFSDKDRYEGQFENGEFSGVGSFHYSDGTIFIGNWKHNKKDGEGKIHYDTGEKIHGIWKEDELIKRLEKNTSNRQNQDTGSQNTPSKEIQNNYVKDCTNTYCHDEVGQLTYQDGSTWNGYFKNGQPDGNGIMRYAGGNRYEGVIKNHAPNGQGTMYFHNGQVMNAIWNEGYPIKRNQIHNVATSDINPPKMDKDDKVKIWAVIVGVSSYAHMPALRYTDDDAYQIYAFLKSPEGGALPNEQIKLLIDENATRNNILAGMNDVLLKADENDVVIMYYSGHGLPGMFLPIDFDGYRNSLQHREVMDIFNQSKAKHKLCIADACHSGSLLASRSPFQNQLSNFYEEYNQTGGGTALIMSSKSEEVSLETSGLRQGIFSHYLIRGLNGEADLDNNKIVTVSELFDFISVGVRKYSQEKQKPTIAGNYDENMPVSSVR